MGQNNWLDNAAWDSVYALLSRPALVEEYLASIGKKGRNSIQLKKQNWVLKQKIEQIESKIQRIQEYYTSDTPVYTLAEANERISNFKNIICKTEKEKKRLEEHIEQQVNCLENIDVIRNTLENIRNDNL